MANDNQDKTLDILLDEYRHLEDYTKSLESQSEKIISLGITLIAVTLGVGLRAALHIFFLLLPVAILAIIFYSLCILEYVMIAAGYAATLEKKINQELGANILKWESMLMPRYNFSWSARLLMLIGLSLSLGTIAYSIYLSLNFYSYLIVWSEITLVFIALLLALRQLIRALKLNEDTRMICTQSDEEGAKV